jgi:hypothetical protein
VSSEPAGFELIELRHVGRERVIGAWLAGDVGALARVADEDSETVRRAALPSLRR